MTQILSVARKELRGYFLSPVALIFLATFLFVVLFSFFWVDTFFRRNIADVRPLFHWLPVLLIFLVSALTMRLWSEEQRAGTLEVLLTLPVKPHRLVLGKFLGALILVAVALALTLGLPLTVSMLGNLDWGPVIGGYLGALMLASVYLAIGLCISATTDNPIVALILTGAACGGLYGIGSDAVVAFAGHRFGEVLHLLGTGSRFESIGRGVLDLRDLVYYGSMTVGFLYLNSVILQSKRWSTGAGTRRHRTSAKLSVALVLANLLVLNVTLARLRVARIDMTERGEYSISPVTQKILSDLDAPLLIRGYFSAKTHPLLAPLVPRVRDLIAEYGALGGDQVTTEFIDPRTNPAAEKEANETYGVKSVPFQFADRHEAAVVNSYFNVLIKYGDKHEKLGFEDLIEVKVTGMKDIEVKLRNLEYDLTRAIKKVVYGFQPLESVFARVTGKVELQAFVTPKTLPKPFEKIPPLIENVAKALAKRSGGKLAFSTVDPQGNEALAKKLYEQYGFKPLAVSPFSEDVFYLHLLLSAGDSHERIYPAPEMTEADLRNEITAALKRLTPGFLKTVGLLSSTDAPPPNPMMQRRPPPRPHFQLLKSKLAENYTVKTVELKDGRVPGSIDVLLVAGAKDLDDKQRFAIDQYLMRGGAVVIAGGRFTLDTSRPDGLAVKSVESKLEQMLESWGITIEPKLVLDPLNEAFPVPVERDVMGMRVREIQLLPYPFWVDVRSDGMAEGNPIVGGLPSTTLQWVSPLKIAKVAGVEHTVLLRSSDKSWVQVGTNVQPDFGQYPEKGFKYPSGGSGDDAAKARPLAVAASGTFTSSFKGKPSPLFGGGKGEGEPGKGAPTKGSRTIERSPKDARLIVVASSDFINDEVLSLSRQTGSDRFANNLQFAQNLVDWSVADTDLLSIRSRGTYARTLAPMEASARSSWELGNYGVVVLALALMVGVTFTRRRKLQPMQLVEGPPGPAGPDNRGEPMRKETAEA